MTVRVSSGFKKAILGPTAFEGIFNGGRILVFTGAQPASADMAQQGTLVGEISEDGLPWLAYGAQGGLRFVRSDTFAAKDPAQAWRLRGLANGTAGWGRLMAKAPDDGEESVIAPRIDFSIGGAGPVDFVFANPVIATGANVLIQQFLYSITPLGA